MICPSDIRRRNPVSSRRGDEKLPHMKHFLAFLKIVFYSGRLLLMVPSAALILGIILILFFPGTWMPTSFLSFLTPGISGTSENVVAAAETLPDADGLAVKIVVVVLFAVLWAPTMIPVMKQIVRHENNYQNLLGLLILTAVPVTPMAVLLWPFLGNVYTLIGFILYAAAAFVWTGIVMNHVAGDE